MRPPSTITITVPLADLFEGHKSDFRAHLVTSAQKRLAATCTKDWVQKQHVAFLYKQEKERRRKFDEEIKLHAAASRAKGGRKDSSSEKMTSNPGKQSATETPAENKAYLNTEAKITTNDSGNSKKAPVATDAAQH
jgi:hypothetical protein